MRISPVTVGARTLASTGTVIFCGATPGAMMKAGDVDDAMRSTSGTGVDVWFSSIICHPGATVTRTSPEESSRVLRHTASELSCMSLEVTSSMV